MFFSDRHRKKKIILTAVMLLGFSVYGQMEGKAKNSSYKTMKINCLNGAGSCRGQTIAYNGRVAEYNNGSAKIHPNLVKSAGWATKFSGQKILHLDHLPANSFTVGETVTVLLAYDENSTPHIIKTHRTDWRVRVMKHSVSILGLGLWFLLFWQRYRFSWREQAMFIRR
jgi:hypothetical protein